MELKYITSDILSHCQNIIIIDSLLNKQQLINIKQSLEPGTILVVFKDINPKGFKTRVKGKLWSIDIYIPQLKLGIDNLFFYNTL